MIKKDSGPRAPRPTAWAPRRLRASRGGTTRSRPSKSGVAGLLLVLLLSSCGRGTAEPSVETIDRETFVATYVDLRSVALSTTGLEVGSAERDSVLELNEVSEDDLLLFVEVHGRDAVLMQDLWNEVEVRIQMMLFPDSTDSANR